MDPGFAEEEWHQLGELADALQHASEHVRQIGRGMGVLPGANRISSIASTLSKASIRWERRAGRAKADAIADHDGDSDWAEAQEAAISEDLAVTAMSLALTELEKAQRLLGLSGVEAATPERLRKLRESLEEVYAEVHDSDPRRRMRWER